MSSLCSHHVLHRKRVSIITYLQLEINRYQRENDKQKCPLIIFFIFLLKSVYFICCCSITNTVIPHVAYKLLSLYGQPEEIHDSIKCVKSTQIKFANQTLYPVEFSTYFLFSFLVFFLFLFLLICVFFN